MYPVNRIIQVRPEHEHALFIKSACVPTEPHQSITSDGNLHLLQIRTAGTAYTTVLERIKHLLKQHVSM